MKSEQNQSKNVEWLSAGQSGAKQLLGSFLVGNAPLPHAFLFFGPAGIGKYDLVTEFAGKLSENFGGQKEHYEFDFLEQSGVEELRQLIRLSSLTSVSNGKKIFILKNFQAASLNSLNGLLKTLEEPTPASLFLLVANSNSTLPTILSRVVPVRCFPLSSAVENSELPTRVRISASAYPKLSENFAAEPELAQSYEALLADLESAAQNGSLAAVNKLNDLETEQLQTLLLLWANWLKAKLPDTAKPIQLLNSLRAAQTAAEELSRNFNTKLVLQEFLLQTKI